MLRVHCPECESVIVISESELECSKCGQSVVDVIPGGTALCPDCQDPDDEIDRPSDSDRDYSEDEDEDDDDEESVYSAELDDE